MAAGTSLLGSICERGPIGVGCCLDLQCILVEGLVAPFEVSREGLVVLLCEAGLTGPCLCGGC